MPRRRRFRKRVTTHRTCCASSDCDEVNIDPRLKATDTKFRRLRIDVFFDWPRYTTTHLAGTNRPLALAIGTDGPVGPKYNFLRPKVPAFHKAGNRGHPEIQIAPNAMWAVNHDRPQIDTTYQASDPAQSSDHLPYVDDGPQNQARARRRRRWTSPQTTAPIAAVTAVEGSAGQSSVNPAKN